MNRREKEQVEREKERYAQKFAKESFDMLQLATLRVLHNEFGFGKQRLLKVHDAIAKEVTGVINSAMIDYKTYKKSVEELVGIEFEDYYI